MLFDYLPMHSMICCWFIHKFEALVHSLWDFNGNLSFVYLFIIWQFGPAGASLIEVQNITLLLDSYFIRLMCRCQLAIRLIIVKNINIQINNIKIIKSC